jgi:predicted AAA+ superfamily ATPase
MNGQEYDIYPMSLNEFLLALGQEQLYEFLESNDWPMITNFKAKLIGHLRHYYFIGGMPEAVSSFLSENDFDRVRTIQKNILSAYEHDFSKHAPAEIVPRIKMLWQSIPSQLSEENKKFIYVIIKQGGRAKEFELALAWLPDCRLVHKIQRISKAAVPLVAYQDTSAFKLFILDIGLLSAMGGLTKQTILMGNSIFSEFKGALAEQFVLQHLKSRQFIQVFYWSSDTSRGELDILIQNYDRVIPIEVKAEENLKAKSLKSFFEKFNPTMSVRTSMSDYRKESWLVNVPLYAIDSFPF